jgi:hypothetical protein
MAQISQAGAGHQTDVSDANHGNVFHSGFLPSKRVQNSAGLVPAGFI